MKRPIDLSLPDGLEYGIVKTEDEVDAVIAFNSAIHEPHDGEELRRLLESMPGFGRELNYYIRDADKGKIVSSLNAIPSVWAYHSVSLKNLELGFVGTLKEYRRMGLIRKLYYKYFEKEFHRGGNHISTIQGIPYFYRQFGYDFLIPGWRSILLRPSLIPAIPSEEKPDWMRLTIHPATKENLNDIAKLYDELRKRLLISTIRDRRLWEIQEKARRIWDRDFTTYIIKKGKETDGYFRMVSRESKKEPESSYLDVIESSIRSIGGVRRALEFLRNQSVEKGFHLLAISGAVNSNLSRVGLDFDGQMSRGWKHQLRIPDVVRFLRRIRPVLEKRIRNTMFAGLTQEVIINTYRHRYVLDFQGGKITEIKDIGLHEDRKYLDFRAPPNDFVRLLLGQYSQEELAHQNIDFIVRGPMKSLIATLFPKQESFIGYYYC
ncbi:MAG: GNAT family N-acetyltransferase [Promethearchaeota archaeon]